KRQPATRGAGGRTGRRGCPSGPAAGSIRRRWAAPPIHRWRMRPAAMCARNNPGGRPAGELTGSEETQGMRRMCPARAIIAPLLVTAAAAQEPVSFPTRDGGLVHAGLYGKGDRAVVLAHGARFNKESWRKQAEALEQAGFRVLAINFRGY